MQGNIILTSATFTASIVNHDGEELQPDSGVSGPFPSHPHHLPHLSILPQVLESPDVERGDDNLQGRDSAASLNLTCVQ